MADTFEVSYEEERIILGSEVEASLKLLGRNKSPEVDGLLIELFQATEIESNSNKNMSTKLENKTMVYTD